MTMAIGDGLESGSYRVGLANVTAQRHGALANLASGGFYFRRRASK